MNTTLPSTQPQLGFPDLPKFKPWYSPIEMINMGIFGGSYFHVATRRTNLEIMFKELEEQVPDYYKKSRNFGPDYNVNFFKVIAIERNQNIRGQAKYMGGWFRWYCLFYYGIRGNFDQDRLSQWTLEVKGLYDLHSGNQAALYKQHLLQFSWDFSKSPKIYL